MYKTAVKFPEVSPRVWISKLTIRQHNDEWLLQKER